MAHDVDRHDLVRDLRIDFTGAAASDAHPLIVALDRDARRLDKAFNLKELTITETAPGVFGYHVECKGGREIAGVVDFTVDPQNPTFTGITTGLGWATTEMRPFRPFIGSWMAVHTVLGANGFSVVFF